MLRCGAELAAVCYQTGLGTAAAPKTAAFTVNWRESLSGQLLLMALFGSGGYACLVDQSRSQAALGRRKAMQGFAGSAPPSSAATTHDPHASPKRDKPKMSARDRQMKSGQMTGRKQKIHGDKQIAAKLQAETFSVAKMKKDKRKKEKRNATKPPQPTERLSFRFWSSKEDFAIAKQLWGDDRVTELIGGPFAVLPLGELRERARLKGASDEQMEAVESHQRVARINGSMVELEEDQKPALVHLIAECQLAQSELHSELSPSGAAQELRDQAVQLRLDAEVKRLGDENVQLYPIFLRDPMAEMLTPGNGSVGCCGLRHKDIEPWLVEVHTSYGSGVTKAFELGFHLRPPYWRRGLGTEAADGVLDYAFKQLKADMIIASCDPENNAARGLLRKLGFQYVGIDMYHEFPNPIDEGLSIAKPEPEPEEEKRPTSKSSRRSSKAAAALEPEPEPEPELNHGMGLTGMFGWGVGRPTFVMIKSDHDDKIQAERDLPEIEKLLDAMTGIGEGSEFFIRRKFREETWTLRDLQRRAQRAGLHPESEPFRLGTTFH